MPDDHDERLSDIRQRFNARGESDQGRSAFAAYLESDFAWLLERAEMRFESSEIEGEIIDISNQLDSVQEAFERLSHIVRGTNTEEDS